MLIRVDDILSANYGYLFNPFHSYFRLLMLGEKL